MWHLRAAIIGEAVKRLMRLFGHRVIGDVHLGDWGLPMGLVMAELSERSPDCSCFTDNYNEGDRLPEFTADELNEIYPFANKKSKSDPDFNNKAINIPMSCSRVGRAFMPFEENLADLC